jgi:hypothetical protein
MITRLRYPKGYQFFDGNGAPLALGSLSYFAAGTTTSLDTYSDSAGTVPNTSPIILDGAGRLDVDVYLGPAADYKEVLTAGGAAVPPWPDDNIPRAILSDWYATGGPSQILNKPALAAVALSGSYTDLSDVPPTQFPFTGDSGSGGTAGLVPAPAAGNALANMFLSANGNWATPPGSPVSINLAASVAAASGSTLTFASVPASITAGMLVTDATHGSVIPAGTTVVFTTSTTVTLSAAVTGAGVASGDTINFYGAQSAVTNLSVLASTNSVSVGSSSGAGISIPAATHSTAGVLDAARAAKIDGLATVAASGSYSDLANKPLNIIGSPSGDMQISASKGAASNVAAFNLQDNYSTRAQLGLIGNDNFSIAVSQDGSNFLPALVINQSLLNIALGFNAGINITTGSEDFLVGNNAGYSLTSGVQDSWFGTEAGKYATTASYNAGFGGSTLGRLLAGNNNAALGQDAGNGGPEAPANCNWSTYVGSAAHNALWALAATSAATAAGSNVLTFASVPAAVKIGMYVGDQSQPQPGNVTAPIIPRGTYVTAISATTVALSQNVIAPGVGGGDFISFFGQYSTLKATTATASGTTLTLGYVPQWMGAGMTVFDVTTPGAIPSGTTVASFTGTSVTLSNAVTGGGVLNGDVIAFTAPEANNQTVIGAQAAGTRNSTVFLGRSQESVIIGGPLVNGYAGLTIGSGDNFRPHLKLEGGVSNPAPNSGDIWWDGANLFLQSGGSALQLSNQVYVSGPGGVFGGYQAGNASIGGPFNTGFGYQAGLKITSGPYNSIFGSGSGSNITTGGGNFIGGAITATGLADGNNNIVIGSNTSGNSDIQGGSGNTIIGEGLTGFGDISNRLILGAGGVQLIVADSSTVRPQKPLKLPAFTVSGLPSAATAGAGTEAWVTDSTAAFTAANLGTTAAGGGSYGARVLSNGTNWIIA